MEDWTALHWLLVLVFFGCLAVCAVVVVRLPPMRVAGVAPHDLANRMQVMAAELEQRVRHLPTPREMRELSGRMRAVEDGVTHLGSVVQAQREATARIERTVDLVMQTLLERDGKGQTT